MGKRDSQREEYIEQQLAEMHDRDKHLQIVPTVLFLLAPTIFVLGQPIVAGVVLLTAILLSGAMAAGVRKDAELAVDVYLENKPDSDRVVGHWAIGCVLLVIGAALIVGMTVAMIGLTLDDPWMFAP